MKNKKSKTGFTLIEVIVAIAILLIAIMGPITVASRSIALAKESKNKIIAFYLAQEGIEYIRKERDDQGFIGNWMNHPLSICTSGGTCGLDVFDPTQKIRACGPFNSCIIKFDSLNGRYGHNNGTDTIFTREITIDSASFPTDEAKVEVTVSWGSKSFILVEHIFNWK